MGVRVAVDEKLVAEAMKLGGHASGREAVEAALREYVRVRERRELGRGEGAKSSSGKLN